MGVRSKKISLRPETLPLCKKNATATPQNATSTPKNATSYVNLGAFSNQNNKLLFFLPYPCGAGEFLFHKL